MQILGKQKEINGKPIKKLLKYKCGYCGLEFKQYVSKFFSKEGERHNPSSQVKCPSCGNFLKTWGEK